MCFLQWHKIINRGVYFEKKVGYFENFIKKLRII